MIVPLICFNGDGIDTYTVQLGTWKFHDGWNGGSRVKITPLHCIVNNCTFSHIVKRWGRIYLSIENNKSTLLGLQQHIVWQHLFIASAFLFLGKMRIQNERKLYNYAFGCHPLNSCRMQTLVMKVLGRSRKKRYCTNTADFKM